MTAAVQSDEQGFALLKELLQKSALPEQAEAATSSERLTVVSAGAGTGKTWTLAWRFLWCMAQGAPAPSILTLTFTEKAAEEMRSRIAALTEGVARQAKEAGCVRLSEVLNEGRRCLDSAYISTIHGFCLRVIKETGLSLPVSPSCRLVSAPEEEFFWRQVADALEKNDAGWFTNRLSCSPGRADWPSVLSSPWTADVLNGREQANDIAQFSRAAENLETARGGAPEDLWRSEGREKEVIESLRAAYEPEARAQVFRLRRILRDAAVRNLLENGKGKFASKMRALAAPFPHQENETKRGCDFLLELADALNETDDKSSKYLKATFGWSRKDLKERLKHFLPLVRIVRDGWTDDESQLRGSLAKLAALCWAVWEEHKKANNLISYSDMIVKAKRVIAAAPEWSKRFRHVLVDEYQDTDVLQDQLVTSLSQQSGAALFLVGDVKQSIYRFRHADPSLLDRRSKQARWDGKFIALNVNFRSSPAVIDAINGRFSVVYEHGLGRNLTTPYMNLRAPERADGTREAAEAGPVGELLAVAPAECTDEVPAEPQPIARQRLAKRLAERLAELKENGLTVRDRESGERRPIDWKDMTVLVPTRTQYAPLQTGFEQAGVPLRLAGNVDYYARYDIRDLSALLRFLTSGSPFDLASFLCSPLSGVPLADAQRITQLTASSPDPLSLLAQEAPALAHELADLKGEAAFFGASRVVSWLLRRDLSSVAPHKRWGVASDLRQALGQFEAFESAFGPSLLAESRFFDQACRQKLRPEAESGFFSDCAVTATTVHSAKGLEFPLVAVFGLEAAPSSRSFGLDESIHLGAVTGKWPGNLTASLSPVPPDGPRLKTIHDLAEEEPEEDEWKRLYYVALTRARDWLILAGLKTAKGDAKKKSWMALEKFCMPEAFEAASEASATEENLEATPRERPSSAARVADGPVVRRAVHAPHLTSISASSFVLWNRCPACWRAVFRQGFQDRRENFSGEETPGGPRTGELLHWALALWDYTPQQLELILRPDGPLVPPLHLRSLWREPRTKSWIRQLIEGFTTLPSFKMACQAKLSGTLEREKPLRLDRPDNLALTGIADITWTDGACRFIRDYKTGNFHAAAQEDAVQQLRFYGTILRRTAPQRTAELDLAVVVLDPKGPREIPVTPLTDEQENDLFSAAAEQAFQAVSGPWASRCRGGVCRKKF